MSTSGTGIEVRTARGGEREELFRLRHQVYVEELGLSSLASGDGLMYDEGDDTGRLLVAIVDGEVAGTLRLTLGGDAPFGEELRGYLQLDRFLAEIPRERMMSCDRFAVKPEHRGGLVALELVGGAGREATAAQVEMVFCDCQPHLIRLYSALGFRSYGRVTSDPTWAIMTPLILVDREYVEQVNSPLLQFGLDLSFRSEATERALALLPSEPPVRPTEPADAEAMIADGEPPRLFRDLAPDEVGSVLEHAYLMRLEHGARLISAGHVTRTVYVVMDGELEALTGERSGRRIGRGEIIGEVAFVLNAARTLDVVVTSEQAVVLGLHEPTLQQIIDSDARAAARLLWNLCETLAERLAARPEDHRPTGNGRG